MDVKRLRYFCTIVEQGQISRAARFLSMSQPPLSQRLKELEVELGTTLIFREDGHWQITAAGEMLYERASNILSELDNLKRQVVDAGGQISGQVSIGISTNCEARLLSLLPNLHRNYPSVRFRVAVMDSSHLEKYVQDKRIDIAILLLPLEADDYTVRTLPPGGFSVVYSSQLSPPDQDDVGLDDLLDVPLVMSKRWSGGGSYDVIMQYWLDKKKTPQVILDSHNIHTLLRIIDIGMPAATIVPTSEVTEKTRANCHVRSLTHDGLSFHPVLITKKGRFMSLAARHVADAIVLAANDEHSFSSV